MKGNHTQYRVSNTASHENTDSLLHTVSEILQKANSVEGYYGRQAFETHQCTYLKDVVEDSEHSTARRLFRIGPPQIDLLLLDRKIEHILLYLFSWICNFYHCSFFFPSLCSFLGSRSQSCYPHAASSGRLTARREDDLSLTASAWSTVV